MPRTIAQGFRDMHQKLSSTAAESAAVKSHRREIETNLKTNFGLTKFWRTGSYGNGTSIAGYSDTDYFASIPDSKLSDNSTLALRAVRQSIAARFSNTDVKVRTPAVVIPFSGRAAETTEVVPAVWSSSVNGHSVYLIPEVGSSDAWHKASPDAHNAYVKEQHTRLGNKLKPLIRFIKAWKYLNNVPVSSFYLEMRTAKYAASEPNIIYEHDVRAVFRELDRCNLASLQDPCGISGYISPCSDAKLETSRSKVATALGRAEKAWDCRDNDNIAGAFDWWRKIYPNGAFPTYYL